MIAEDVRARIRRLFFAEHWKRGTSAAELDVHRDTVARAVDTSLFATVKFRAKAQMLDPYRDFVRATLDQYPRLCSTTSARDDPRARLRGQRVSAQALRATRSAGFPRTRPFSGSARCLARRRRSTGARSAGSE